MQGLLCLQDACKLSADEYRVMWEAARKNAAVDGHISTTRQKRAMERQSVSESKSWAIETERRIGFLHVDYEIARLMPQPQHDRTSKDATESVCTAEKEFSRLAEVDVSQARANRKNARPYLYFARRDFGLGYLLMLGTQTRKQ